MTAIRFDPVVHETTVQLSQFEYGKHLPFKLLVVNHFAATDKSVNFTNLIRHFEMLIDDK